MRRRDFIVILGGAMAWPLAARAQPSEHVRRIGVLIGVPEGDARPVITRFQEELARLGWVEGRNLRSDYRFTADPDRLAAYADELVNLRPDAIFAFTGWAARAIQQRTQVIPIVFLGGGAPLDNAVVNSLARPGGNMTGFANLFTSLGGKWLVLLKVAVPRVTRIAIIFDEEIPPEVSEVQASIDAAPHPAITIVRIPLRSPAEIERDIGAFAAEPNGAMLWTGASSSPGKINAIERQALQYRLPMMFGPGSTIRDEFLMSYGADVVDLVRGVSSYIDRILRGATPGDLPAQYQLVVNLKVSQAGQTE